MRIVVVGSGLAGVTVAESLARENDVIVVTAETHGYYARPRLSHGFSSDADILLKPFGSFASVRVLADVRVERIDRNNQLLIAGSAALPYDVLVLATGSAARIPAPLAPFHSQFFTLNSLEDLLAIRRRRAEMKVRRWTIVGGGLIGCELASDLHKAGDKVEILHRESRLLELQLEPEESRALHEHFNRLGIDVLYSQDVREIGPDTIVCAGFAPRVELARDAGLATERGIVVNEFLRTDDPAIYAVGDVAQVGARLYPFVSPIRSQALWLSEHIAGRASAPWSPPAFRPVVKIHGFAIRRQAVAVRG